MSRRLLICLLTAILVLAACGGGDGEGGATTTPDDETTTTQTETPTTEATTDEDDDGDGETVGIGDLPQECIDVFVAYLRDIEPFVEDVDWANASSADLEELNEALEPITEDYESTVTDADCDDLEVDASAEESFSFMIDLAQQEAPGTVAYFEMIRGFAEDFGGESDIEVSNDCETDIATLQAIVDEGVAMQDRPIGELAAIGALTTSITANCDLERSGEFFAQEDVTDFMGG